MIENILYGIKNKLKFVYPLFHSESTGRSLDFHKIGFHGDKYLLEFVDYIICNCNCNYFIESGTNVGSTLAYVAGKYPNIQCISCEPDKQAFEQAVKNTSQFLNVLIFNETSQIFSKRFSYQYNHSAEDNLLFWLDAHGYGFKWPLKDELGFITRNFKEAYILIDDFKVPGLECFGYDQYQEQICSFDYIKDALNPKKDYKLIYPNYTIKTSKHHPLRGWVLIEFGHENKMWLPENLRIYIFEQNMEEGFNEAN